MTGTTKAYIALAFICIVWGTTYLAIRLGVLFYPAFLFAGVRQTIAGIILVALAIAANKNYDLSFKNILQQMTIGFLMITVGNGCVTWGEKNVSSGVAALLCSMMPIFAVLFGLMASRKEHFNASIGIGLLLGVCGVGLIFKNNIQDLSNTAHLTGILSIIIATCAWAYGSIKSKKTHKPVNPMFNAGLQLLFGGLFMFILSPIFDDYSQTDWWQPKAFYSLLYLITFGSVLAYGSYMYVLSKLPVGIATIYAYINPLVAVVVGYFAKDGDFSIYTILAFITIICGVFLVNRGYRKQHKQSEIIDFGDGPLNAVPVIEKNN